MTYIYIYIYTVIQLLKGVLDSVSILSIESALAIIGNNHCQ